MSEAKLRGRYRVGHGASRTITAWRRQWEYGILYCSYCFVFEAALFSGVHLHVACIPNSVIQKEARVLKQVGNIVAHNFLKINTVTVV